MFRLEVLKNDKLDRSDEHDKSTIGLEQRMSEPQMSEQSGFGDKNQLQNIRTYQGLSRRIQVFILL